MSATARDHDPAAELLTRARERLRAAGVENARREAQLLLDHVRSDAGAGQNYAALVARRAAREPMSHILGRREFWSLDFRVSRAVLDPRPDSECLIEAALAEIPVREAALDLLDLGTGSGCLLLALLTELPRATGRGVDRSRQALDVAKANADALGLTERVAFMPGDWGRGIAARFDIVLCNPPYVPSAEIAHLMPEVARHEPRLALDGGADGLACYRRMAPELERLLRPGGFVAIEIGHGQAVPVTTILRQAGLRVFRRRRDLASRVRCLLAHP